MAEPALANRTKLTGTSALAVGTRTVRASSRAVTQSETQRAPERLPRSKPDAAPSLTVLPRERRESAKAVLPMSVKATLLVAIFILASIPFIRIWLANDTMRMLVSTRTLEQQVSSYRAEGHRLESRYSAMTNPQTIQHLALELGMLPDNDPTYMRLAESVDQLAWDPAGSVDTTTDSDEASDTVAIPEDQVALADGEQLDDNQPDSDSSGEQGATDIASPSVYDAFNRAVSSAFERAAEQQLQP